MEILGVGPWEIVAIFIIMLVVAGPKRMISWAYQAGRYTAKLRAMLAETMAAINKELEESGVDVRKDLADLPKLTNEFNIVQEATKILSADLNAVSATDSSVTNSSPTSTSSSAVDSASTEGKDDHDKPRYDSWLPN